MDTINKFEMQGKIGSLKRRKDGSISQFFVNSFINGREMSLLVYSNAEDTQDIEDGDVVRLSGYVTVTPPIYRNRDMHYDKNFYAEEIIKVESEMEKEFGVKGNYYAPDYFKSAFKGVIVGQKQINEEGDMSFLLQVDSERSDRIPSRIPMIYRPRSNAAVDLVPFYWHNNDAVEVVCTLSTRMVKDENGKKIHYQNLRVVDISSTH